jgi:hypothetical protein
LTADVSGVLPEANGGTDQSTYAAGDILYASAANTLSKLAKGSDNDVLTLSSGLPAWAAPSGITRIAGSSGASGSDITWQNLTSDVNVTSTTLTTVMTTTGVGAGTYKFKYTLIYQSSGATTGVGFAVNHTGTTGEFVARWDHVGDSFADASGVGDDVAAGRIIAAWTSNTVDGLIGGNSSSGVVGADTDIMAIVEGIIVVTATGSLQLKLRGENAIQVRLKADSCLELHKIE